MLPRRAPRSCLPPAGRRLRYLCAMERHARVWAPRIVGILVCVFLGLFALDAFEDGMTVSQALPGFFVHLAPTAVLLAVVALSWRWEWIGGLAFTGLAAAYAYVARNHVSWIVTVSGPLLLTGILFFWSWLGRLRRQR